MGKDLIIAFSNSSGIFYPGQNVKGEIQLTLKDELKIKEIRVEYAGFADVHWVETRSYGQGNTQQVHFRAHEDYFKDIKSVLLPQNGEDSIILKEGEYKYPFDVKLPNDIPPSFQGDSGKIEYSIKATVDRPWAFDKKTTAKFTVAKLYDLNKNLKAANPGVTEGSKTMCCLCCRSGPITGKFRIDKIGYVPGEAIPITAEIINHSNRDIVKSKMALIQVSTFKGKEMGCECCRKDYKVKTEKKTVTSVPHGNIGRGDSDTWTGDKLIIPPVPVSELTGCSIMDVQYQLHLKLNPSRPAIKLRIPLDIIIGSVPLESTAKMYGTTNPNSLTTEQSGQAPEIQGFPENIPRPAFASFELNVKEDKKKKKNSSSKYDVQKGDGDDDDDDRYWKPQYAYYNWNDSQSAFKY